MKFLNILLMAFFMGALFLGQPVSAQEISARDAKTLLKDEGDLLVIDVRTPAEYQEGHIAKAQNIDFFGPRFETELNALPKDKDILVYCRSGKRSAEAEKMLEKAGYEKVHNLKDGLIGWEKSGGKVEK